MDATDEPVVLITGCTQGGIGQCLAHAFAAEKCAVVATSRSIESMEDLKNNERLFLQELDVLSEESLRSVLRNVLEKFGRIDVLVNNAGVHCVAPLAEIPLSDLEQTFNTNVYVTELQESIFLQTLQFPAVLGAYIFRLLTRKVYVSGSKKGNNTLKKVILELRWFCECKSDEIVCKSLLLTCPLRLIQAVVPHMASRRKGKIVNIGSTIALVPGPWAGAYSASKAALHSLSDTLRLELRTFGIDVITVVPGAIRSNLGNTSLVRYEKMPEWKLFKPFEEAIRARTYFSQGDEATPGEEFAKKTVAAVLKKRPPAWFSYGTYSTAAAIMYHLPLFIRDFIVRRKIKC
ncbi:hypothetical protein Scep_001960 [Stephania cephalantha]|uniref:NADPH-dependent 1-acyldihydroxyacetone phosphate reductase n=1 Tax=Stephania cephalantha TaxID=152367 RepID=A0AAP0LD14_9MAGN